MPLPVLVYLLLLLFMPGLVAADDKSGSATDHYTITVLGDSLTAGYGLPHGESFPAQLEKALRARSVDVKVINSGISGDTTAGGLSRIGWVLEESPDLLIVALGANDALRGLDPESTRNNLAAIIERALAKDIEVLLAGMKAPRNFGSSYYTKFDRIYSELASRYGIELYPFFLEGVATDATLNQKDGIHPNQDGIEVMVNNMLPIIEKMLPPKKQQG